MIKPIDRFKYSVIAIVVLLAGQIGPSAIGVFAGIRTMIKTHDKDSLISPSQMLPPDILGTGISLVIELLVVALGVWLLIKWKFIGNKKINWWLLILGVPAAYLLIFCLEGLISILIRAEGQTSSSNQESLNAMTNYAPILFFFIMIVIAAPIIEELVFRGLIQQRVFNNSWLGYIVSSLLFCLAHTPNSWGVALIYASMGVIIGFFAFKFKRLEYSIALHTLNNLIAFFIMYGFLQ
ncbi:CPBP family intramembrane glutamic endopeptidase [Streptococcus dentapri]|uniref:CPBP family intramembrane glutamic endopeptidase n=1 Tax=Streptococcus dentapri TaxID=573564 RepID=A0ABV8CZL4_9STRE